MVHWQRCGAVRGVTEAKSVLEVGRYHMTKNTLSPNALAKEFIRLSKSKVECSIQVCSVFADAWRAYEENEWNNKQFSDFANYVYDQSRIGPDPNRNLLVENKEGRFTLTNKEPHFSRIKSVGSHVLFKDKEILAACRISSVRTLYLLTRLYDEHSAKKATSATTAKSKVMKHLILGTELRQEDIEAEIAKLKTKKKSYAPTPKTQISASAQNLKSKSPRTYQQLSDDDDIFDTVFLTPPEKIWSEIDGSDETSISEKFPYRDLLQEDSEFHILAPGENLTSALKLASAMGENSPRIYAISKKEVSTRIVDMTNVEILVSNIELKIPKDAAKSGSTADLVLSIIQRKDQRQLHLFAEDELENWAVCIGENSSRP